MKEDNRDKNNAGKYSKPLPRFRSTPAPQTSQPSRCLKQFDNFCTMNSIEATLAANHSVPLGPEKKGLRPLHSSRPERRILGSSLSSEAHMNYELAIFTAFFAYYLAVSLRCNTRVSRRQR